MQITERRYDIDWLRVIAIGLLLIYHVSIGFQPWGILIRFIQNSDSMESLWVAMSALNIWRIPFLFFVSGMGVCFAIRRRDWKALLSERSKRILLPFVFGMLAIAPLHMFVWQDYYRQEISYLFSPGHLWFLGNIFAYVLILSPIFFLLKKKQGGKFQEGLSRLLGNPLGLIVLVIPFVIEAVLVNPEAFEMYAMTAHGFWLGLIAFFIGFCCVYSGRSFWPMVAKWKWLLLAIGVGMYLTRILYFQQFAPKYLMAIESNAWIFAVFGIGFSYLNKPSAQLTYLSQAAYPIYIVHMLFLYLASYWLFPMEMTVELKFALVLLLTFAGCFASYEFVIRRVSFLRPLFGLKGEKKRVEEKNLAGVGTNIPG